MNVILKLSIYTVLLCRRKIYCDLQQVQEYLKLIQVNFFLPVSWQYCLRADRSDTQQSDEITATVREV